MEVIYKGDLRPWEKVGEKAVMLETRHMSAYIQDFKHPVSGAVYQFSQIKIGDYVIVMPFTETGNLVLTNQWKQGVEGCCPQFPGGAIGAAPITSAATLILKRETGYEAESMMVNPTRLNLLDSRCPNHYQVVIARGCRRGERLVSVDAEVVEVLEINQGELLEMIKKGEMQEPSTYAAVVFAHIEGILKF